MFAIIVTIVFIILVITVVLVVVLTMMAVVPAEAVPSRPIGPAQLPHLRTDEESALRIAVLETKVTGLEIQVEKLQQQLKNVMDIMARHDMQVLPSEAVIMAELDFQVLPSEGAEERQVLPAPLERLGRRSCQVDS